MHLTFALIACEFLALVSADPANDRLIWRKSHRKRDSISSKNSTVAVNSTQPSDNAPSASSSSILTPALLPSSALPSSPPPSSLGTAPLPSGTILPAVFLAGNSTLPDTTSFSGPPVALGTGASIQNAVSSDVVQLLPGTGGLYPTAGSSDTIVIDTGAGLFANSTTTDQSSPTILRAPLVTGTGSGSYPTLAVGGWNSTGNSTAQNSTCGSCVVNAQAGLDWWYSMNIFQAIASISTIPLNGTTSYSLVPAQTTINVTDELWSNGATFIFTETFDPSQNTTVGDFIFTTLPPPAAATTSITTISDVLPPPNGTFGIDVLQALNTDPGVPTFAVPGATGTLGIVSQPTNAVYYTAYEVESVQQSTDAQGQVVCATTTATYQLSDPFVYEFDGTDLGVSATETGDLNTDFLAMIPQSSCSPGIFVAASPVMIVVVEVTYQRGFSVFLVHHEVSDSGSLDVPSSTTDGGAAAATSDGSGGGASVQSVTVKPVVLSVDNTVITVSATVTGNPASVPVSVGTRVVTGSVVGGGTTAGSGSGGSGGGIASAIVSVLGGGTTGESSGGGILNNIASVLGVGNAATTPVAGVGFTSVAGSGSGGSGSGSSPGGSGNNGGSGSNSVASAVPVLTVGGQTFVGNAATQFLVAPGQTLTPGGVATVGFNTVSLAPGATALVVNGVTSQIAVPAATPLPALNIGGQVVTANAGGSFIIQGQTLTQGGQITVGTNTVSLAQGASSLVVNGQTITRSATLPSASPVLAIDGTTFVAATGGQSFIIGGQTLTPGGVIVANGNTISLGTGASSSIAVVNGVTETLAGILTPAALTLGSSTFTELPGGSFVVEGQTLRPGSTAITVEGTTLSLGAGASVIVINGKSSTLAIGTVPAIVIGGTTYAATSALSGAYIIGGQTLTPGGVITVNGHTISLAAGATALVIDGSTSLLNQPASITSPPLLTFEGKTFTANSGTTFVISGKTLTPGGIITVDGHTISLASGATAVVIDGKTTTLFPATKTPNAVSAIATGSTTKSSVSKSTSGTGAAAATTSKKGAASPSTQINLFFTSAAIFVAFLGTLGAWM